MNRPGDSAGEKADPSFWAFDMEMAAKVEAGCLPGMRRGEAKFRKRRHHLFQSSAMAAPAMEAFSKSAPDGDEILQNPKFLA